MFLTTAIKMIFQRNIFSSVYKQRKNVKVAILTFLSHEKMEGVKIWHFHWGKSVVLMIFMFPLSSLNLFLVKKTANIFTGISKIRLRSRYNGHSLYTFQSCNENKS